MQCHAQPCTPMTHASLCVCDLHLSHVLDNDHQRKQSPASHQNVWCQQPVHQRVSMPYLSAVCAYIYDHHAPVCDDVWTSIHKAMRIYVAVYHSQLLLSPHRVCVQHSVWGAASECGRMKKGPQLGRVRGPSKDVCSAPYRARVSVRQGACEAPCTSRSRYAEAGETTAGTERRTVGRTGR